MLKSSGKTLFSFFTFGLLLLLMNTVASMAQSSINKSNIKIEVDLESAQAIIALFDKGKPSEADFTKLLELHGTKAILEKVASFNPNVSFNEFRSTLRQVIETGTAKPDPFRFMLVKNRLPQVRELLKLIEQNPQALTEAVIQQISKYSDTSLQMNVTVHFLLGGTSNAFAKGEKDFYVGLQYFGNDYDGLREEMAHELFHNAQARLKKVRRKSSHDAARSMPVTRSVQLLDRFVDEATAVLVGNPEELKGDGTFSKFYQGLIARNNDRMTSNFALFELMLYRLYNDQSLNSDYFDEQLRFIGLSDLYDSPFYIMGYQMAKTIEKYKGQKTIASLIGKSPTLFFKEYIEIYKKNSDPEIIRFSQPCEDILLTLTQSELNNAAK